MFLSFFALLFFCFLALSAFTQPAYDHAHYLQPALQGFSFDELIRSSFPHRSPSSEFLYLFIRACGGSQKLGLAAFNGFVFAAIVCSAKQWLGTDKQSRLLPYLLAMMFLLLNPSILALSISANKDFLLILYVISLFRFTFDIHNKLSIIERLIGFFSAFVCIATLRTYLLYFSLVSIVVTIICGYVRRRDIALMLTALVSFLFVSSLLEFKWNEIRILAESAYSGRASIPWILKLGDPAELEGPIYSLLSIFTGFFGHFTLPILDISVSWDKVVAGIWQNLMFLIFLPIAFLNTYGSRIRLLLVSFLIIHFGIQTMGSPNFGALLRLRLSVEVITVFLAFWSLEPLQGSENEGIA
jgi:hypothetical protein